MSGSSHLMYMLPSTQTQVDAVLFDLYGTLVDVEIDTSSPAIWSRFSQELAVAGVHLAPDDLCHKYAALVQAEEREHGQAFVLDPQFFHKLLGDGARRHSNQLITFFGRRFRALTTRVLKLRSYTLPLLSMLRRSRCRIGLVSNTEAIVTGHDLETLNIHDLFDTVVLSASVGIKKPDPGIFHIALHRIGAKAERTLFIGDDHVADFQGATRVGLSPVLLCRRARCASAKCTKPTLGRIVRALELQGWQPPANTQLTHFETRQNFRTAPYYSLSAQ